MDLRSIRTVKKVSTKLVAAIEPNGVISMNQIRRTYAKAPDNERARSCAAAKMTTLLATQFACADCVQ